MPPESSPPPPADDDLARAVSACRRDQAFLSALAELLDRSEADLARLQPPCRACGECCRFASAGHRLFASTGEVALLTTAQPARAPRALDCPYQAGPECTARRVRPLGCRVYFCDPGLTGPTQEVYERFHAAIRHLHDAWGLGYHYVELTAALCEPPGREKAFFRVDTAAGGP